MSRVLEIKMFPTPGAIGRLVPYEILGRIRAHFVGRVLTLAAATAFNAILSIVRERWVSVVGVPESWV